MSAKFKVTAKGRIAPNGYRLCDPLKVGDRLISTDKTEWIAEKPIGAGGFGEVYTCHKKNEKNKKFVVKVDNIEGPLFVEIHFMTRVCKDTIIETYVGKRQIDFLGIPKMFGLGIDKEKKLRFLVIQRLGDELDAVLNRTRLPIETVCRITCRIIDALEFIHENGYIHADIKAANILRRSIETSSSLSNDTKRGRKSLSTDQIDIEDDHYYLIDFGLAEKFIIDNVHRAYEEDERRANNGTREFRSRDAHIGVISRRSDMESLGWNLIIWFYGRHPWDPLLKCDNAVYEKKCWAMKNIPQCLEEAFSDSPLPEFKVENKPSSKRGKKPANEKIIFERPERTYQINTTVPKGLDEYFYAVEKIQYDERPNYVALKNIIMSISKLNPPITADDFTDSPLKKPKITAGKGIKARPGRVAKTKVESDSRPENNQSKVSVRSKPSTVATVSTATELLLPPSPSSKTNSKGKATKTKSEIENISNEKIENIIPKSSIVEPNTNRKIKIEKHHEPKNTAVNGRPKRGVAAADQAPAQSLNDTLSSPEKSPDKHASTKNGKNPCDDKNDKMNSISKNVSLGRFSKRARTSTYLHDISFTGRILRSSSSRLRSDSDDDDDDVDYNKSNRRLSAKPKKLEFTNGITNHKAENSNHHDSKNGNENLKINNKNCKIDNIDLAIDNNSIEDNDNDDTEEENDEDDDDDDDILFGYHQKINNKNLQIHPLSAKNGRSKRYETPQMIKLRQKLESKKASSAMSTATTTISKTSAAVATEKTTTNKSTALTSISENGHHATKR